MTYANQALLQKYEQCHSSKKGKEREIPQSVTEK